MSIIIEVLDKLVYLNDQKVILTMKSTYLHNLKIDLGYFTDYSQNDSPGELINIDKNISIDLISFWYNEDYNTYTIEIKIDKQSFQGNFFKIELLTFLKSISENQVLKSTVDITKIF